MVVLAARTDGGSHSDADESSRSYLEAVRQMFISGAALTIPALVTAIILMFVINFVLQLIRPPVAFLHDALGIGSEFGPAVMEGLAVLTLLLLIFLVGFVAEERPGSGLEEAFDTAVARIPGVGSIYTSFNEMSELLLSNDTQSFREVKLVEFPTQGSYTIAFVTAETPDDLAEATHHDEMTTLFMPMAPNPVMGGFVLHVSEDRVYDVDISVEEGIRSIVTSGVATGEPPGDLPQDRVIDLDGLNPESSTDLVHVREDELDEPSDDGEPDVDSSTDGHGDGAANSDDDRADPDATDAARPDDASGPADEDGA